MFIATLFTIAKIWKQPKCPLTYEWIHIFFLIIFADLLKTYFVLYLVTVFSPIHCLLYVL